jgi:hypothetical protein
LYPIVLTVHNVPHSTAFVKSQTTTNNKHFTTRVLISP